MRETLKKSTGKIVLAMFCMVALAWCAMPRQKPPTELRMILHGNKLVVPVAYIPKYERGWYRQDGIVNDGLNLDAEWKAGKLYPFAAPEDNTAVWIRYQNKVSILIQRFGNNTLEQKYQLSQHFASIWMPNRRQMAKRYGLKRYEHNNLAQREKEDVITAFYEQDLYLYPSRERIETQIVCDADFFPDPGTERASALQKRGKFVINPLCSHDIFLHGLRDSHIEIGYFRSHLPEWQAIEQAVVELLDSFNQEPEKALLLRRPPAKQVER
ncbi:hypothetical protein [Janthinobacterium sp.]|uniref:hypothetical protein n=1 Tax=Janthinobacterium sp. TaxID=1871054 RepID=UPI00289A9D8D|nr:hypothetical protein [Janthinobacterium sp.]